MTTSILNQGTRLLPLLAIAGLADAMASADHKNWRLQLNATSLGDTYYVQACSGGANCAYGTGRSIYATLAYRW